MSLPYSFSLWITSNLESYQQQLCELRSEYYLSQLPLSGDHCSLAQLRQFNDLSLKIADLCYAQGDDENYFLILQALHHELIKQLTTPLQRAPLFAVQVVQLARYSMTGLCQVYIAQGKWDQACALQKEFLQYADALN